MQNAESILVIIVSSVLTLFLVVAIVLLFMVIKLVQQVKKVVDKAENAVESIEQAGELFKNTSGPMAVVKLIRNIMNRNKKKGK